MAHLTITLDGKTSEYALEAKDYVIGRSSDCDICLPSGHVSKRHARLVAEEGSFKIVDLASTGGTKVGGHKVGEKALRDGDEIKIGDALLVFHHKTAQTVEFGGKIEGPYLEFREGAFAGKRLGLGALRLEFGRKENCSLQITDDPKISSRHAEISLQDGQYFISDLGSTNGTYLNGEKVTLRPLRHGDHVSLGAQRIYFFDPASSQTSGFQLVALSGGQEGEEYPLREGEPFVIGRNKLCNLRLDTPKISQQHCSIGLENGRWLLKDIESRNGTFLNGHRVVRSEIKHGDRIRAGDNVFVFRDVTLPIEAEKQEVVETYVAPDKEGFQILNMGMTTLMQIGAILLALALIAQYMMKNNGNPDEIAPDESNLLAVNASFEEEMAPGGAPNGWQWEYLPAGEVMPFRDTARAVHGGACLGLTFGGALSYAELGYSAGLKTDGGEAYALDFHLQSEGFTGVVAAHVTWWSVSSVRVGEEWVSLKVEPTRSDYACAVQAPEGAASLAFGMCFFGKGGSARLLLDRVRLARATPGAVVPRHALNVCPQGALQFSAQGVASLSVLGPEDIGQIALHWSNVKSLSLAQNLSAVYAGFPQGDPRRFETVGLLGSTTMRGALELRVRATRSERGVLLEYSADEGSGLLGALQLAMTGISTACMESVRVTTEGGAMELPPDTAAEGVTELRFGEAAYVVAFPGGARVSRVQGQTEQWLAVQPQWRAERGRSVCAVEFVAAAAASQLDAEQLRRTIEEHVSREEFGAAYQALKQAVETLGMDADGKFRARLEQVTREINSRVGRMQAKCNNAVDLDVMKQALQEAEALRAKLAGGEFETQVSQMIDMLERKIEQKEPRQEPGAELLAQARAAFDEADYERATGLCNQIIEQFSGSEAAVQARALLVRIQDEFNGQDE